MNSTQKKVRFNTINKIKTVIQRLSRFINTHQYNPQTTVRRLRVEDPIEFVAAVTVRATAFMDNRSSRNKQQL